MRTRNKLTGMVFLLAIFAMLFRVVATYIPLGYQLLGLGSSEPAFDALAVYPYTDTDAGREETSAGIGVSISRAYTAFDEFKRLITTYMSSNAVYFMDFVVGKRLADRVMGLDMTASLTAGEDGQDVVAVWRDDYLGYVMPDADNASIIENVIGLGKRMQEEDRNFLYFMVPSKQTQSIVYQDYSEDLRYIFLQSLREQGLDTFDVMDVIVEGQLDMKDLFFKTDHHWLPSVGIWADQLLCGFMNKNYGYCIDTSVFDPENYDTMVLEDSFLGSLGRKVTTVYCKKEDFPIVIPKYDTNLEVFISGKNMTSTGSIQDTLFDYEFLEKSVSDIYGGDAYCFYGYGNQALITIHNDNIQDGSRVLIIKTSDANVMYPYLSAVVEDLYVIDLRHFNGSLRTFIDETNPDTVVVVAGVTQFDGFDFSDVIGA